MKAEPKTKNTVNLNRFSGWIAPDGKLFAAAWSRHEEVAYDILRRRFERDYKSRAVDVLRRLGYVSAGAMGYSHFVAWTEPTQAQMDIMFDICEASGWQLKNVLYVAD